MDVSRELLEKKYYEADGRLLAVRIRIHGSTKIHQDLIVNKDHIINNLRSLSLEVGHGDIWVEKVKIKTSRLNNIDDLKSEHTPVAIILDYIQNVASDEGILKELLAEFQDIQHALPYELRNGDEGFDFNDTDVIKKRIQDVEDLILYYLTEIGVEA